MKEPPEISILALQVSCAEFSRPVLSERKLALHELECGVARKQSPFELSVFHRLQNLSEPGPACIPGSNQVVAGNQRCGTNLLRRNLGELLSNEVICAQVAVAGQAVGAVQCEMLLESRQAEELLQCRLLHARDMPKAHVIVDQGQHLSRVVIRKPQALADFLRNLDTDIHVIIETD